jgi:hypothetical protein
MENEDDNYHFDVHSSDSSSRLGPVDDFLQLRVDDSLSGPERVQVLQDDTWSTQSVSTISGMIITFDRVEENISVSATRPSTHGANVASPSTNIGHDEEEKKFHVLTCCLWNRDKSPSRSRRVAWFRQLPLVAKIGFVILLMLFVASIVTIIILSVGVMSGMHDNNDEQNPSSTDSVDNPATSPTNLSTAIPVASFTDSPTSSPVFGAMCADDTAAAFFVNTVNRDCAWLSEHLAFQVLLCRPGHGALEFCRQTCNNCPT